MNEIRKAYKAVKKFNLDRQTAKNLRNNKHMFLTIIRDQMRGGEKQDGDTRNYRSLLYANEKASRSTYLAPYPRVDYYDTGSFQNKMYILIFGNSFEFSSKDSKTAELIKYEGIEILRYNQRSMELARSANERLLAINLKKAIG